MDFISPITNYQNNKMNTQEENAKTLRATRSDKLHPVKFPVASLQRMKLRTYHQLANRILTQNGQDVLKQTAFNTALLRYGLQNENLIDWEMDYKNSENYMYTKLRETEYSSLVGGPYGLSIQKGLSDRKLVYVIVFSVLHWLERGGNLEKIIQ